MNDESINGFKLNRLCVYSKRTIMHAKIMNSTNLRINPRRLSAKAEKLDLSASFRTELMYLIKRYPKRYKTTYEAAEDSHNGRENVFITKPERLFVNAIATKKPIRYPAFWEKSSRNPFFAPAIPAITKKIKSIISNTFNSLILKSIAQREYLKNKKPQFPAVFV